MPIVRNDPFPGTDYSQYLNWKKVTAPDGRVFYVVPGHEGYALDPVASNATGRKVFIRNPAQAIADVQEAEALQRQQFEQQQFNQSPMGQALPIGLGVGGIVAANHLMPSNVTAQQMLEDGRVLMSDGTFKGGEAVINNATTPAGAAAQGAIEQTSPVTSTIPYSPGYTAPGVEAVGSAEGGGTLMSDGSIQTDTLPAGTEVTDDGSIINSETGQTVGRVAQGAFGAYQIYQGFNEFGDDKISGTLGIASGAANIGQALGYESASGFAAPLMAAKGGYDMYKAFQRGGEGVRGAGATLGAGIGTMIAPGLGTLAGGAIGNAAGYALDKFAPGAFHKTTKQREQDRWSETGVSDEVAASMIGHDYFEGTGGEESRDESLLTPDAIRLNPDNYNNIPDWDQWSKDKQDRFLSTMLREGKVQERKGGIYYDDARAKELADQIRAEGMNIQTKGPMPGDKNAAAQAAAQGAMSRTSTRSPGIRLDGSRIVY